MRGRGQLTRETAVAFAGGEPAIYPAFESLLAYLCENRLRLDHRQQQRRDIVRADAPSARVARIGQSVLQPGCGIGREPTGGSRSRDHLPDACGNRALCASGARCSAKMIVLEETLTRSEASSTVQRLGVRDGAL